MRHKVTTSLAMEKLGGKIAQDVLPGSVIYLQGELGAGKTTFVRGFLRALGYQDHVRSPTFNIFEVYQINDQTICHLDLYRLKKPEEIAYLGIIDYFDDQSICLIEWPEKGKGCLLPADIIGKFNFVDDPDVRVVDIGKKN